MPTEHGGTEHPGTEHPGTAPPDSALAQLRADLRAQADPRRAANSAWFFQTGPGQYGEGDAFLGIRVPRLRAAATRWYRGLSLDDAETLLRSPFHEERLTALLVLVLTFDHGTPAEQTAVYELYLRNTAHVNNWDLVDSSAPYIVGRYLESRDKADLLRLARSSSVCERRIAVLGAGYYIRQRDYEWPLRIIELVKSDRHDLIQKAVGWMLREIGKRDRAVLVRFLTENCRTLPRTALRYAIEHFSPQDRQRFLKGEV
jgi:3-methyladenine DNA glycosylase AlkD